MGEFVTIGLLVIGGVVLLLGGALAAWRLIPRPAPPPNVADLAVEVAALRLQVADLDERFVTFVQRDRGRKRKKRADDDDEEPVVNAVQAPPQPALTHKQLLRRAAVAQGLQKG